MQSWIAHFVDQPPVSGTEEEHSFETDAAESSAWSWVRFEDSEGDDWYGAFKQGRVNRWRGIASADQRHYFVIAAGVLYCVDAAQRVLVSTLAGWSFQDILPIPHAEQVAVADLTEVAILDRLGLVWKTPRIAWDGVRLLSATDSFVEGVAETGHGPSEDAVFTIDLHSRTAVGGHMKDFENYPP